MGGEGAGIGRGPSNNIQLVYLINVIHSHFTFSEQINKLQL